MKFSKLETDLENVSRLSDRPNLEQGYSAEDLKAVFDKAGIDIKKYINEILLEELESIAPSMSGADRVGSSPIDILSGDTVQDKFISVAAKIKELVSGVIPDGSVTPDKFSPEISSFLTSASIRSKIYKEAGDYTLNIERSGTYKITVVGGGAGGGIDPSYTIIGLGGGSGAGAVVWCDLSEGDVCTLKVGKKGKGLIVDENMEISSRAEEGSDSEFYINSDLCVRAGGGKTAKGIRATADGGDVNYSGGLPKIGRINTSSTPYYLLGGDSILGMGAGFEGDMAGIGAGGFGAERISGAYYKPGSDGADGAIIIEYIS